MYTAFVCYNIYKISIETGIYHQQRGCIICVRVYICNRVSTYIFSFVVKITFTQIGIILPAENECKDACEWAKERIVRTLCALLQTEKYTHLLSLSHIIYMLPFAG